MMKQAYIFIFLIIFTSDVKSAYSKNDYDKIKKISIEEFKALDLSQENVKSFQELLKIIIKFKDDTLIEESNLKSDIFVSILAKKAKEKFESKEFTKRDLNSRELLSQFEKEKYFIYQPIAPSSIKLAKYVCDGCSSRFHIYNRFRTSSFFYPLLISGIFFIIFFFLNIFGKIPWKHKKLFNKTIVILSVLFIIGFIIFKFTCDANIKTDYFYGIYF